MLHPRNLPGILSPERLRPLHSREVWRPSKASRVPMGRHPSKASRVLMGRHPSRASRVLMARHPSRASRVPMGRHRVSKPPTVPRQARLARTLPPAGLSRATASSPAAMVLRLSRVHMALRPSPPRRRTLRTRSRQPIRRSRCSSLLSCRAGCLTPCYCTLKRSGVTHDCEHCCCGIDGRSSLIIEH